MCEEDFKLDVLWEPVEVLEDRGCIASKPNDEMH